MSVINEIRRRGRNVAGSILGAMLFAYFAFHAVQGDRGVLAWMQLRQQIGQASAERDRAAAARGVWEARIALLKDEHIDADMLDERARLLIGLGRKDELVILHPDR